MRRTIAGICVLFAPCLMAQVATAQESTPRDARWSIEVFGGSAGLDPADLNAFSRNRELVYSSYYEALFQYYESAFGQNFSSSITKNGAFPLVGRGWTGGIRVARQITPRVAATVAFHYLSQSHSASLQRGHDSTTVNPDAVSFVSSNSVSYQFTGSRLAIRSYAPQAGVRWTVWRHRAYRLDAVLQGGLAWGSTEIDENLDASATFYGTRSSIVTRMRGHGWGASAEAGVRAGRDIGSRWGVFVEATYLHQRIGDVEGSFDRVTSIRDGDATSVERETAISTTGRWRMQPYQVTAAFGSLNQPYPGVGNDQYPAFQLDLSGARVQIGLALRFNRIW